MQLVVHWFLQLYTPVFYKKNMRVSGGVFLIKVLLKKWTFVAKI